MKEYIIFQKAHYIGLTKVIILGMGIADNWFKKRFEKTLMKMIQKVGHSLTQKEKEKIVKTTGTIYMAIITLSFAIFMIYFFMNPVADRLGTDKTIILILIIMMLKMRWN